MLAELPPPVPPSPLWKGPPVRPQANCDDPGLGKLVDTPRHLVTMILFSFEVELNISLREMTDIVHIIRAVLVRLNWQVVSKRRIISNDFDTEAWSTSKDVMMAPMTKIEKKFSVKILLPKQQKFFEVIRITLHWFLLHNLLFWILAPLPQNWHPHSSLNWGNLGWCLPSPLFWHWDFLCPFAWKPSIMIERVRFLLLLNIYLKWSLVLNNFWKLHYCQCPFKNMSI